MPLRIHPSQLRPEALPSLLQRLIGALSIPNQINSEQRFWIGRDFKAEADERFTEDKAWVINPQPEAKTGDELPPPISARTFTLQNVATLISGTIEELRSLKYRDDEKLSEYPDDRLKSFYSVLNETVVLWQIEQLKVVNPGEIVASKQEILIRILKKIISAFDALFAKETGDEVVAVSEARHILPDWLLETKEKPPFFKPEYYKVISKIISPNEVEPGYFDKSIAEYGDSRKQNAASFPGVSLGEGQEVVSIVTLRKFFNAWADKVIAANEQAADNEKVFVSTVKNEVKYFPEAGRSVDVADKEYVQDLDATAITTFRKFLIEPWQAFLKRKKIEPTAAAAAEPDAEDGGSESPEEKLDETKKEPLPKDKETQQKLTEEILTHQKSTREEAVRMEVAATGFFLAVNNLPSELELPFEVRNSEGYRYFQKELMGEILDLLNKDPTALDDINRREQVLHKLLFSMMANPKFQIYLQKVKEEFVNVEVAKAGLTGEAAAKRKQEIFEELAKNPQTKIEDLLKKFNEDALKIRPIDPSKVGTAFDPRKLTKEHFSLLFDKYDKLDEEAKKKIFEAADLLMFMRTSPERVAKFTAPQLIEIFGDSLANLSSQEQQEITELLGVYLGLRRGWFEEKYNSESVSQSQDTPYDGDLTAIEKADLEQHRQLLKEHPNLEAHHLVRAAMLTPTQLTELAGSDDEDAEAIQAAAELLKEERKKAYEAFLYEMMQADATYGQDWTNELGGVRPSLEGLTPNQMRIVQDQLENQANLSHFEHQSGVVLADQQQVVRSSADAEAAVSGGKSLKGVKTAFNAAINEGAAFVGGLAVDALLPGVGFLVPKEAKKAIGKTIAAGAALGVGGTLMGAAQLFGSIASSFGTGIATLAFGAGGSVVGFVLGGGLPGMAIGGFLGTVAGIGFSQGFGSVGGGGSLGFGGGPTGLLGGGAAANVAATAAPTTAASLAANVVGAFRAAASSTAGVAVVGFVSITTFGTYLVYTQMTTAFLPPVLQTTTKYLAITKTATPAKASNPSAVQYAVHISANAGYKIEITSITDTVIITAKDKNKNLPPPAQPNFSQYVTTLDSAATGSEDITYTLPYDASFQDTLVTNTITVKYNATGTDSAQEQVTSAQASTCFGDCPAPKAGCWPTTGEIVEGPFELPRSTHNHPISISNTNGTWVYLDAVDIWSGNKSDVPIYTPFAGTVSFYTYNSNSGEGGGGDYGNRAALHTADGQVLLFAHFDRFMPNFQPGGQTYTVNAGDQLGYMGTTGDAGPGTYPKHLHYELRPATTGPQGGQPAASKLSTLLPEEIKYKATWQVTGGQNVVSACGASGATATP